MAHTPARSFRRIAKRLECLGHRNPSVDFALGEIISRTYEHRYFAGICRRHAILPSLPSLRRRGRRRNKPTWFRNKVATLNILFGKAAFRANFTVLRFNGMPAPRAFDFG